MASAMCPDDPPMSARSYEARSVAQPPVRSLVSPRFTISQREDAPIDVHVTRVWACGTARCMALTSNCLDDHRLRLHQDELHGSAATTKPIRQSALRVEMASTVQYHFACHGTCCVYAKYRRGFSDTATRSLALVTTAMWMWTKAATLCRLRGPIS
jgi:hypothetical protein